jgi:hypothetical protein
MLKFSAAEKGSSLPSQQSRVTEIVGASDPHAVVFFFISR